jgi:hypothetical protein
MVCLASLPLTNNSPRSLAAADTPNITIDLSRPNLEAVSTPGTPAVQPYTIMRADQVGYHRGRTVGVVGASWVAYTLARGRIRLIDLGSGARAILQLEATGPIIDLAVTANGVAVVGSDGVVSVSVSPRLGPRMTRLVPSSSSWAR